MLIAAAAPLNEQTQLDLLVLTIQLPTASYDPAD
jgi:hypothetical protein